MRSILSTELMYGRVIPAAMPLTTTNTTTSTTLRPHHSLHPRTLYPDYALRSLPKVNLVFPNSLPPKVPMGYVDHNFWVINETPKKQQTNIIADITSYMGAAEHINTYTASFALTKQLCDLLIFDTPDKVPRVSLSFHLSRALNISHSVNCYGCRFRQSVAVDDIGLLRV